MTRIDTDRQRKWRVAIRRCGQSIAREFHDSAHGGKRKALAAAKIYRDALEAHVATFEADHRLWRSRRQSKGNSSGAVGVGRYLSPSKKPGGKPSPYWQAFWLDAHGQRRSKGFRVGIHGENEAKKLALLARDEALAEVHAAIERRALKKGSNTKLGKEAGLIVFTAMMDAESLRPLKMPAGTAK